MTTEETIGVQRRRGAYIDANGVRTYYEIEGVGAPLVLLHGGMCAIETFEGLRRELVDQLPVHVREELPGDPAHRNPLHPL